MWKNKYTYFKSNLTNPHNDKKRLILFFCIHVLVSLKSQSQWSATHLATSGWWVELHQNHPHDCFVL